MRKRTITVICALSLLMFFSISAFAAKDSGAKASAKAEAKTTQTVKVVKTTSAPSQPTAAPSHGSAKSKSDKETVPAADKTETSEYSEELTAAEDTALADLGIAREDAKYIKSYMRYSQHDVISGIHVEIGVYDRSVSPRTVVHIYEISLDGEITDTEVR